MRLIKFGTYGCWSLPAKYIIDLRRGIITVVHKETVSIKQYSLLSFKQYLKSLYMRYIGLRLLHRKLQQIERMR